MIRGESSMKICHVLGARPNYMKVAPVHRALSAYPGVQQMLVHTGQHYDFNMSDVFFQQLQMQPPDINLQVGSGTHGQQTAHIMRRIEPVLVESRPDWVLVYGDVNSTIAAALVCAKLGIRIGHVEAGLRSFDRTMPEEINRILTDRLADLLFTPSEDADINLLRTGISPGKIRRVGNVMIDTLVRMLPAARNTVSADIPDQFILVTLHRPSNVDQTDWLASLMAQLTDISRNIPVLFPVHPRTRPQLAQQHAPALGATDIRLLDPLPYLQFLGLQTRATLVITDSGGIQEETSFLGTPCLTVRDTTERPVTLTLGTNLLVGRDLVKLRAEVDNVLAGSPRRGTVPPLWDGHSAERIAEILCSGEDLPELSARELSGEITPLEPV